MVEGDASTSSTRSASEACLLALRLLFSEMQRMGYLLALDPSLISTPGLKQLLGQTEHAQTVKVFWSCVLDSL